MVLVFALIAFIIPAAYGMDTKYSFKACVEMVMAMTPELCFAMTTLLIGIQSKRLRDMGTYVRNLESVDTLGAIDMIVIEKSGTITHDHSMVWHLYFNGSRFDASVNWETYKKKLNKFKKSMYSASDDKLEDAFNLASMKNRDHIKNLKFMNQPPSRPDYADLLENPDF